MLSRITLDAQCASKPFEAVVALLQAIVTIVTLDYRLTPKYTCIDAAGDCEDGYRHLLKAYAPKDIILIGESAGGNLVFALSRKPKDDGLPLPGGIVSCSPPVQFLHYAYSYYECSRKTDYGVTFFGYPYPHHRVGSRLRHGAGERAGRKGDGSGGPWA